MGRGILVSLPRCVWAGLDCLATLAPPHCGMQMHGVSLTPKASGERRVAQSSHEPRGQGKCRSNFHRWPMPLLPRLVGALGEAVPLRHANARREPYPKACGLRGDAKSSQEARGAGEMLVKFRH